MVGFKDRKHSEETKLKMSLSKKGRPGRVQSEENQTKNINDSKKQEVCRSGVKNESPARGFLMTVCF